MARPEHFKPYLQDPEIVPGVFVDAGIAVYIVDAQGEVCSWNEDEWDEDPLAVTATVNACVLAAMKGAAAVRANIGNGGQLMQLLEETQERINKQPVSPVPSMEDLREDLLEFLAEYGQVSDNAIALANMVADDMEENPLNQE